MKVTKNNKQKSNEKQIVRDPRVRIDEGTKLHHHVTVSPRDQQGQCVTVKDRVVNIKPQQSRESDSTPEGRTSTYTSDNDGVVEKQEVQIYYCCPCRDSSPSNKCVK